MFAQCAPLEIQCVRSAPHHQPFAAASQVPRPFTKASQVARTAAAAAVRWPEPGPQGVFCTARMHDKKHASPGPPLEVSNGRKCHTHKHTHHTRKQAHAGVQNVGDGNRNTGRAPLVDAPPWNGPAAHAKIRVRASRKSAGSGCAGRCRGVHEPCARMQGSKPKSGERTEDCISVCGVLRFVKLAKGVVGRRE